MGQLTIPSRLKKGFIFIQANDECPANCSIAGYTCYFQGGLGILYKLDPLHGNGAEPISVANYLEQ